MYVFPFILTTFFLFLGEFSNIVQWASTLLFFEFFTNMLLQSRPGCFARAPPHRLNEGEMTPPKYNVKLASSLLKTSKLESFCTWEFNENHSFNGHCHKGASASFSHRRKFELEPEVFKFNCQFQNSGRKYNGDIYIYPVTTYHTALTLTSVPSHFSTQNIYKVELRVQGLESYAITSAKPENFWVWRESLSGENGAIRSEELPRREDDHWYYFAVSFNVKINGLLWRKKQPTTSREKAHACWDFQLLNKCTKKTIKTKPK